MSSHDLDDMGICRRCGEGITAVDLVDGERPCSATPDPRTEEPVRNPDGLDPRTEEIRARMAAYSEPMVATVESIDFDPPCAHVDLVYALESRLPATPGPYAEFLNHAPADLAYLLDRNKALEEGRETEQTMLRNAATLITDMADYQTRLRAERDQYRAVVDAARALTGEPGEPQWQVLAAALESLDGQS